MKIFQWLRNNWLVVILVLVIAVLIGRERAPIMIASRNIGVTSDMAFGIGAKGISMPSPIYGEAAPVISDKRLVVQDTNMSMLVKDVSVTIKNIEKVATDNGGYMVNKSLNQPEGAASGNITIRVPIEKREETLDEVRKLGVKVVSENVYGDDVTDEYVDIETRIANLERTKARMIVIQDQATNVSDLFQMQNQIDNIQQQIDNLKGRKNFLEQTAKLTRITVSLSTDELALPYAPDEAWRPAVVFKQAVRSMIGSLRRVANVIIWGTVYLPVVLALLALAFLLKLVYAKYLSKVLK